MTTAPSSALDIPLRGLGGRFIPPGLFEGQRTEGTKGA